MPIKAVNVVERLFCGRSGPKAVAPLTKDEVDLTLPDYV